MANVSKGDDLLLEGGAAALLVVAIAKGTADGEGAVDAVILDAAAALEDTVALALVAGLVILGEGGADTINACNNAAIANVTDLQVHRITHLIHEEEGASGAALDGLGEPLLVDLEGHVLQRLVGDGDGRDLIKLVAEGVLKVGRAVLVDVAVEDAKEAPVVLEVGDVGILHILAEAIDARAANAENSVSGALLDLSHERLGQGNSHVCDLFFWVIGVSVRDAKDVLW